MSKTLSDDQIKAAAENFGIEPAALKAVARVESGKQGGFLPDGQPVILFEGHVFWKELRARSIDPNRFSPGNEDILYEKWTNAFYQGGAAEHRRLQRAVAINKEAALCSASWGLFQVMGFNWPSCGFKSLQDFINAMYRDEAGHLQACLGFIKAKGLKAALQRQDWAAFARGYNGQGYAVNKYDIRLAQEYAKAKQEGF